MATDALLPVLVARWKDDCVPLPSTRQASRSTARVAVRQLGGKERFISRWVADVFFPSDWSAERGLLGSYEAVSCVRHAPLALWPTTNPDADKPERVLISKPKTGLWQGRFSPEWSVVELRSRR